MVLRTMQKTNKGKKILYVTSLGITMDFFCALIRELLDRGYSVDVATNEMGGEAPVLSCYREWGCRVFPLSCSRSPTDPGNLKAIRQLRELVQRENYDQVHCHTPKAAACTRAACRGLRKTGLKVFYTAHGFHFYTGAPLKNWLIYYPVEWLCAHWTDTLITINREDYARARRHLHAGRVAYVPGVGIDVERFAGAKVDRAAKRRELGVPEDAVLLLSVGELNENKNHAVVLHALARLNDERIHYRIAGCGALANELEKLAAELGLSDRVRLLGQRSDMEELYKSADVFVFPSMREGLPVALMEAMAAGLPVVGSRIRGCEDLLADSDNLLIDRPGDAAAFAEAIKALANDPARRKAIGKNNPARLLPFGQEKILEQMEQLYS